MSRYPSSIGASRPRNAATARARHSPPSGSRSREHHTPSELSGGQQQRVAIARAIVSEPALLLADEPTGNLDSKMGRDIMELLANLNQARGITIAMVTHEPDMAAYTARQVRFHDGRIVADERGAALTALHGATR